MQSEIGGPGVATFTEGPRRLVWQHRDAWLMGALDQSGEWVYMTARALPQCDNAKQAARVARQWIA